MLKFLCTDWIELLFNFFSLKIYEREQKRLKRQRSEEKNKIIRNNRIIVKVNDNIIYDSKKEKDMSDELYYALLSYGLKESINSQNRSKKTPIHYNIIPSISTLPNLYNNDLQEEII